jgi:hypothetical protein
VKRARERGVPTWDTRSSSRSNGATLSQRQPSEFPATGVLRIAKFRLDWVRVSQLGTRARSSINEGAPKKVPLGAPLSTDRS